MSPDQEEAFNQCELVKELNIERDKIKEIRNNISWITESGKSSALYREMLEITDKVKLIEKLFTYTDEQRLEILNCFCKKCGSMDTHCVCWNDG